MLLYQATEGGHFKAQLEAGVARAGLEPALPSDFDGLKLRHIEARTVA